MASSNTPGSLVWDHNNCNGFSANPILPGSNSSRVCGLKTQDESDLGNCCGTSIQKYTCWQYCETNSTYEDFNTCVNGVVNRNVSDLFCLESTNSTIHQEATSAGPRTRAPSMTSLLAIVCLFAFFLSPASAEIIPSLGRHVRRADTSSCKFEEDHHYVTPGNTNVVANGLQGGVGIPITVDSGISNNNRTVNGTSAAEAEYDDFFDILSTQFKRAFPAMSSIQTVYEFSTAADSIDVGFTPFHWCVNGTAMGCGDVLRDMNGSVPLVACGPVFVSDTNSTESRSAETLEGEMIQGTLGPIVTA